MEHPYACIPLIELSVLEEYRRDVRALCLEVRRAMEQRFPAAEHMDRRTMPAHFRHCVILQAASAEAAAVQMQSFATAVPRLCFDVHAIGRSQCNLILAYGTLGASGKK